VRPCAVTGKVIGRREIAGPDPERQAFAGELRALIESAIEGLPEHYGAVFVMREVEGMSTAESAECLDITEQTAKTHLHRARMLLRDTLYQRAGIESGAAPCAMMVQLHGVSQPCAGSLLSLWTIQSQPA
jgi:RNA polymerase sigma-70 factor (ECF subfamily)